MKKYLLFLFLLSFSSYSMDHSLEILIQPENFNETLVEWKKYFIGDPNYNDILQAILKKRKEDLGRDTVTQEHNLDRLIRFLTEKKNVTLLHTILPKLVEQKESWKPGNQAQKSCYELFENITKNLTQETINQEAFLNEQIEKLKKEKKTLEKNNLAAKHYFTTMQKQLIELGHNKQVEVVQPPQNAPSLKTLVSLFNTLN